MIKLSIPQVPLSLNQTKTMMWTKFGQKQLGDIKRLWQDEIWYSLEPGPRGCGFEKAKISIKIFFKTNAKRDADNYPCKEVIDAIKNNGLIIDDNYDVVGKVDIDIMGRNKNNPHTEIIIEEIK